MEGDDSTQIRLAVNDNYDSADSLAAAKDSLDFELKFKP